MSESGRCERMSGEDLTFWWLDSPMQPTTMAMLLVLDRPPSDEGIRQALWRAITAVPRLTERVVEAPLGITLPHWEFDPTFDLEYHCRRHSLSGSGDMNELLREIAPVYETPFDRSRPLWESRLYDHLGPHDHSALFFKLHHAVADGVGANAIFAAMSDCEREPQPDSHREGELCPKGCWGERPSYGRQVVDALRDRVALDVERVSAVAGTVLDSLRHPQQWSRGWQILRSTIESLQFDSRSPLKKVASRARRLSIMTLSFDEVRQVRNDLDGSMIDVILTVMARAMGQWYAEHQMTEVKELMTLVPVNLRKPEDWTDKANVGNVATGILVPLPIAIEDPLVAYGEIHKRMVEKKADPLSAASPVLAEVLSVLPRQLCTWMAEASFGAIDFIVTNVPGIMTPRYVAGTEILAAFPFAPVAMSSPASVALYGYRDRLFIGVDSDEVMMPDVESFQKMIQHAFHALAIAARGKNKSHRTRKKAR